MNSSEETNMEKEKEKKERAKQLLGQGYLEVFFDFHSENRFSAKELFTMAEKAECHNTGWPIGVTLTKPDLAPFATDEGIEAFILSRSDASFDYWSIKKNGNFYFIRTHGEDTKPTKSTKGNSVLWLDTRIWRIAEVFLYCQKLGNELKLNATNKIDIIIIHTGLKGRTLVCGDPMRIWFDDEYFCKSEKHQFRVAESLDFIKLNYKELIFKLCSDLFYFFSQCDLNRGICDGIVDDFLKSRV